MSRISIKCINCGNKAALEIPNNSEIIQVVGMDKLAAIEENGDNHRTSVCPHGCGTSTIAVLKLKNRDKSEEE